MSLSLLAQVALAAGPIVAFLEGTVVYALSQQWEDLLSTYLFRLHAVPNCGEHLVLACSPEASAPRQFRYVAGLLATSALVQVSRLYLPYISPTSPLYLPNISIALVQTWAEVGPLPYAWHVWRTVSLMEVACLGLGLVLGLGLGLTWLG